METKHTPGPWLQGRLLDTQWTHNLTRQRKATYDMEEKATVFANFHVSDQGRSRIRIAFVNRNLPESDANARLIAAAPELLEACKAAVENLAGVMPNQPGWRAADLLNAAIAKAEGD